MDNIKVAVIGLGPAGLTAVKSLREEGFDAVGFDRRERVGGVWDCNLNPNYTSVLKTTVANVSKFVSGFSDFPIPKEYPPYMTARQVAEYFQAYASYFKLEPHLRFNTTVRQVVRGKSDQWWNVHITGPDGDTVLRFDKVIFGTGLDTRRNWPRMPGKEIFQGTIIHAQSYAGPEKFAGKQVLVVGLGNTACEVSLSLVGHASKVYQSYRRGRFIVPSYSDNGVPTDSPMPWAILRFQDFLNHYFPRFTNWLRDRSAKKQMIQIVSDLCVDVPGLSRQERDKRAEEILTHEWRLFPCASIAHVHPVVVDNFMPALSSGHVIPVRGFSAFKDAHAVLLDDNTTVDVDAVIFCTGYSLDFSIMPELEMDGACGFPLVTAGTTRAMTGVRREPHLPRLHHMIFPPRWASSLAFLSWLSPVETSWTVRELASMAVAQIWAAESARELNLPRPPNSYRRAASLPSESEMNNAVDKFHTWWRGMWEKDHSLRHAAMQPHSFNHFLHGAAGTGMYAPRFRDWRLWTWLFKGPANNYAWRMFETNPLGIPGCGRKRWPGAKRALEEAFDEYEGYKRDMKDEERRKVVMTNNKH